MIAPGLVHVNGFEGAHRRRIESSGALSTDAAPDVPAPGAFLCSEGSDSDTRAMEVRWRLKGEDIDKDRDLIHIREGKRRKDRHTMLSSVALRPPPDYPSRSHEPRPLE